MVIKQVVFFFNMVREFRKIDYILVHGRSPTAFRIIQVIQNIYSDDKIIQFTIETRILLKQLKEIIHS